MKRVRVLDFSLELGFSTDVTPEEAEGLGNGVAKKFADLVKEINDEDPTLIQEVIQ